MQPKRSLLLWQFITTVLVLGTYFLVWHLTGDQDTAIAAVAIAAAAFAAELKGIHELFIMSNNLPKDG